MTTTIEIQPESQTEPRLDGGVPSSWPPLQHIIRNEDLPAREGSIALCGTKLMGIDLGPLVKAHGKLCGKCLEVLKQEIGGGQ